MEQNKIDMFVMTNKKNLPAEKIAEIQEKLANLDAGKEALLSAVELKDTTTMFLVSFFLGSLGIDRFMLGETGLGVIKLLTIGGCGIWTIIDWITVMDKTRQYNYNKLLEVIG